jgi:type I site-specific restriction endonuclease
MSQPMTTTADESEYLTRRNRIDPQLRASGWRIVSFDPATAWPNCMNHAVTEFPTDNGPADCALFLDGQPAGIIEAKKITLGPQNVLVQAERYAKGVADSPFDFAGCRIPFLYSTNGELMLTAAERGEAAFAQVTAGRGFTPEQQQWLDRIRQHLAANLTIDREDFSVMPILSDAGGWGNAIRVFGGELETFIAELNVAMAA